MSTTTNLDTLKINYLTQAQYETALNNGQINENEIYLTPSSDSGGTSVPTANNTAKFDAAAHMNSTDMTSSEVTSFLADINAQGTPSEYKKLLWTNASPSSSFSAQTILSDVDLTEYDEFEIEVRNYITGDIYNICRFENASQRQIWVFDASNFTGSTIPIQLSRIVNISSSGMAISNGYSKAYNSTSAPNNSSSICLPIKVYGIKYEKVAPIQVDASDYVIEQGTSGSWIYRKWNSGIAECWIRTANGSAVTIYYPITFTELPRIVATSASTTSASNYGTVNVFTRGITVSKVDICFQSNVASADIWADVYVIGKWK